MIVQSTDIAFLPEHVWFIWVAKDSHERYSSVNVNMFLYETYHNPFLGFEGAAVVFSSALRFVPDGPGTLAAAVSLLSPSDELDLGEELPVEEEVTVEDILALNI